MMSPAAVLGMAAGVRTAKVLLVAEQLEVFTTLAAEPLTAAELAAKLSLDPIGARDLLVALEALGLVERPDGRYRNAADAEAYLVRGRPGYVGGFLRFLDEVLHPAWDDLATALRTGARRTDDPYPGLHPSFVEAMDVLNAPIAAALAALDWSRFTSFVDVGGARGRVAAAIQRAHPGLSATVFDLPAMAPAFAAAKIAAGDPAIAFHAGDFFTDPLPPADVLIFGHVLHNWPLERRLELLAKAFVAARRAVLVYDPMIDPQQPQLGPALASLNMLVWSAGGSEYTAAEGRSWLLRVGFTTVTVRPLGPTSTLLMGEKA